MPVSFDNCDLESFKSHRPLTRIHWIHLRVSMRLKCVYPCRLVTTSKRGLNMTLMPAQASTARWISILWYHCKRNWVQKYIWKVKIFRLFLHLKTYIFTFLSIATNRFSRTFSASQHFIFYLYFSYNLKMFFLLLIFMCTDKRI